MLNDAYLRLRTEYVDASKVEKISLIRGAVTGMAEAS